MKSDKEEWIVIIAGIVLLIAIVLGSYLLVRWFNQATINHQIIQPKAGIECVVVTATDSSSVDCWKTQ